MRKLIGLDGPKQVGLSLAWIAICAAMLWSFAWYIPRYGLASGHGAVPVGWAALGAFHVSRLITMLLRPSGRIAESVSSPEEQPLGRLSTP